MNIPSVMSASATTATATANKALASDFTTFLKMLTTQIQNQDPLKPMDSSDFAVQLATFSGVEQQVQTNQLLAELMARQSQSGMAELAGLVGKDARTTAAVYYDGRPVTLSPSPAAAATRAVIAVTDARGNLVAREEIPVSTNPYQWLGADASGAPLPTGRYSLTLESWSGDVQLDQVPVNHYAQIVEARVGGTGGTKLLLEGGIEVLASSVTGLRRGTS